VPATLKYRLKLASLDAGAKLSRVSDHLLAKLANQEFN
jgi:hypothetical protein